jgi:hypothetical protein
MNRLAFGLVALLTVGHALPLRAEDTAMTQTATIVVHLHADADAAFPLFDPVNESKWDPDWKPQLLGGRVEEGLVFLVEQGGSKSTWVVDRYDPPARTIGYVVVTATTLTRILIRITPNDTQSVATVTYTRTALDEHGINDVEHFAAHFPSQAPHWERAINDYLDSHSRATPPRAHL